LLASTTLISPELGFNVWTYFQSERFSKEEYSVTVRSFPDATHIIYISKSLEKCGVSGPGTKCSAINTLPFSGEDL
jgi:hypothetical protein